MFHLRNILCLNQEKERSPRSALSASTQPRKLAPNLRVGMREIISELKSFGTSDKMVINGLENLNYW